MNLERREIPKETIEDFCKRHHIKKLSIFGSYMRDDFAHESDIDFVVGFEEGHTLGYLELAGMEL